MRTPGSPRLPALLLFCGLLALARPVGAAAMIEPPRLAADWLKGTLKDFQDVDQGIAAQLTKLSTDGLVEVGDTLPTIAVANIVDETRDHEAARRAFSKARATPLVAVLTPNDFSIQGEVQTVHVDADAHQLLIGWFVQDPDSAEALTQAYYGLRAIRRSLGQWHRNENQPKRKRNEVLLWQCREIRQVRPQQQLGDLVMSTGLVVTYALRDGKPQ